MIRLIWIPLLLLFCACTHSSPRLHTAKVSLTFDPTMLDPRRATDLDSQNLIRMLFEGLTRTSRSRQTELALVESFNVDDKGLRYEFHLRKSFWSNGEPLTSFDFVFSWKTILDPQFSTDIAYQLYPIKNAKKAKLGEVGMDAIGVKAIDEQTLVVELEQPIPYFLELISMPAYYPVSSKAVSKNPKWHLTAESFVSNGPFLLHDWSHSNQLHLFKNDHYWEAGLVKLSQIDICIASPDTALQMFEEGKLDWAGSPFSLIPPDAIAALTNINRLKISPFLGTSFYRVNTSAYIDGRKNPLADPRLRRLLGAAINREGIVNYVLQGGQKAAFSLVPSEMELQYECSWKQDLSEKLTEPVTISYLNSERNSAVAQAVQKQWEKALGIQVRLEAVEPKVFYQRVSKKEYQIAGGSWTADFNDPINFLEVFKYKDGSANNTGWENSQYIDLLNRSSVCKIGKERIELLRKAEEILMDEMPIIPVYHFVLNYMKNPKLSGVVLSPMGHLDLRWAYFEMEKQ